MREFIVITIKAENLDKTYDLEVPTGIKARQLAGNIRDILNAYLSKNILPYDHCVLYSERLQRMLSDNETFYEAGIWNGDVIQIRKGGIFNAGN